MQRSTDRILTTHTGSLPRPLDLAAMLEMMDAGMAPDPDIFKARTQNAVAEAVRQQVDTGLDIVNDGEQSKVGYSTYVRYRYDAIAQAGFLLQIDCPDLAMGRHLGFLDLSISEFLSLAEANVEVLNHALRDIPSDRIRMHLCWGNYEGPHHRDIPLRDIIQIVLKAKPQGLSFEGSNPRHEHEWVVFQEVNLPADKVLIPGVIDTTTNFIEHPELVAQRIIRYAEAVGKENVIAGTDCGFGTFARSHSQVEPEIAWAKLSVLAEGAQLASNTLWGDAT